MKYFCCFVRYFINIDKWKNTQFFHRSWVSISNNAICWMLQSLVAVECMRHARVRRSCQIWFQQSYDMDGMECWLSVGTNRKNVETFHKGSGFAQTQFLTLECCVELHFSNIDQVTNYELHFCSWSNQNEIR